EAGESPNGKDHAEQSQRRQDLGPRIEPVDGGVHRDVLAEDEPLKELHGSGLAPAAPRGRRSALRPPSGYRAGPAARAPAAAGPAAPSAAPQARGPGAEPGRRRSPGGRPRPRAAPGPARARGRRAA